MAAGLAISGVFDLEPLRLSPHVNDKLQLTQVGGEGRIEEVGRIEGHGRWWTDELGGQDRGAGQGSQAATCTFTRRGPMASSICPARVGRKERGPAVPDQQGLMRGTLAVDLCPPSMLQEEVMHLSPLMKLPLPGGSGGVAKVLSLAYGTNELPFMMAASRTYHERRAMVRG